ncbi:hypothetical protein CKAH01_09363 [Colletotrichum kahawae]|uniref:Uncharacterized protein n=1 Tax=Colletotrichum kahawae TaxID=34407 RepID=A0AAD9XYS2_COLKA|nr:hypothetical protein CKAH01_09363 [Colletotrichum kahawae]
MKGNISRLPNELICCIVKCANDDPYESKRDLLSLCLLNRHMYLFAQLELYREVEVRSMKAYALLTRSFIENPGLRKYVREAHISVDGHRYDTWAGHFQSWANEKLDMTRLCDTDRSLVILCKTLCSTGSSKENSRSVLALLLTFLDRAEEVRLEINGYCRPPTRVLIAYLDLLSSSLPSASPASSSSSVAIAPRRALFPSLRSFWITGSSLQTYADVVFGQSISILTPLLSAANLTDLRVIGDARIWDALGDSNVANVQLPLKTITLDSSTADGSGLCYLLKRCPNLRRLKVFIKSPRQNGTMDINTVLPEACPQLKELSLNIQGYSRFFKHTGWASSPAQQLTCLPQMHNLKELRISLDCFFNTPANIELMGSNFPDMLPPRLEKIFIDATWSLLAVHGRITASHPQVVVYKKGIEKIITTLCTASKSQLPCLKVIALGAKYGKPKQWTRDARRLLGGTNVKLKLATGNHTGQLWHATWKQMLAV